MIGEWCLPLTISAIPNYGYNDPHACHMHLQHAGVEGQVIVVPLMYYARTRFIIT